MKVRLSEGVCHLSGPEDGGPDHCNERRHVPRIAVGRRWPRVRSWMGGGVEQDGCQTRVGCGAAEEEPSEQRLRKAWGEGRGDRHNNAVPRRRVRRHRRWQLPQRSR